MSKAIELVIIDPCPLSNQELGELLSLASQVLRDDRSTLLQALQATRVIELVDEIISSRLFMVRLAKDLESV